jgi:hypothetical protein
MGEKMSRIANLLSLAGGSSKSVVDELWRHSDLIEPQGATWPAFSPLTGSVPEVSIWRPHPPTTFAVAPHRRAYGVSIVIITATSHDHGM